MEILQKLISLDDSTLELLSLIVTVLFLIDIFIYGIRVFSMCLIFKKCKIESWKSFIPFYNRFILSKLCKCEDWFLSKVVMMFIFLATFLIANMVYSSNVTAFIILIAIAVIDMIIYFPTAIASIFVFNGRLAESFGFDKLFACGLFIVPVVCMPIVAISNNKYVPIEFLD